MKRTSWIVELLNPADGSVLWRRSNASLQKLCDGWHEQTGNRYLTVARLHNWRTAQRSKLLIRVTKPDVPVHELNVEDVG